MPPITIPIYSQAGDEVTIKFKQALCAYYPRSFFEDIVEIEFETLTEEQNIEYWQKAIPRIVLLPNITNREIPALCLSQHATTVEIGSAQSGCYFSSIVANGGVIKFKHPNTIGTFQYVLKAYVHFNQPKPLILDALSALNSALEALENEQLSPQKKLEVISHTKNIREITARFLLSDNPDDRQKHQIEFQKSYKKLENIVDNPHWIVLLSNLLISATVIGFAIQTIKKQCGYGFYFFHNPNENLITAEKQFDRLEKDVTPPSVG